MKNSDLKEIKDEISKVKHPRISKILESDKIDKIISKIQNLYRRITDKLIVKYNLEDELKQGKIFTILFALLTFIFLVVITVFFTVTLHSIIGIGLLFSVFRQIVFCIKWGYTILKNKGKTIKKYLADLFPNSKILQEEHIRKKIPLYEENILYQIEDFIEELDKANLDMEIEKEITIKLKEVINMLDLNNLSFQDEIKSLEYKNEVSEKLAEINKIYQDQINLKRRQDEFINLKNDLIEQINGVENKVYVKQLKK